MTTADINKILTEIAGETSNDKRRTIVLELSFALLEWMKIEPNAGTKPQLLSPQTQKLKDYLATAPQTVQPQLYRLSADNQNIRVRFAVLKKLKKDYISQLVDNDPGLSSYQSFSKGLAPQNGTGFIPAQPYFVHFITTPDYDKLVMVFNQGEQKRVITFRNRLTNTQYNRIILQWQSVGAKSKPEIAELLWRSLDIKEVNKEFYRAIKERFDALLGIVKTQNDTATENQIKQFTVRLIGRYIFCWFLKEKGIIPHSLISKATIESTDNYYQNVLLKLFFETLNTKVQDRNPLTLNKLFEKIPYLNGGLFDESDEDKLFTKLKLDAWLLPFVEILESYDFTIDESSSQYQQVAVDPEMLGRIFENLLASQNEETEKLANQRKAFGAFYTPREIVDYMVNESIKAYLVTALDVKDDELNSLFVANPIWPDKLKGRKGEALSALEQIKILDPACGSGAFPMGVLHKLAELHELLGTVKSSYELKKDILSQNIYGVDIMPMAIEIARLRAWLSLVLEEEYKTNDPKHNFGVKPLPNLDFKFVCANSLIDSGFDMLYSKYIADDKIPRAESMLNLAKEIPELIKIKNQYFDAALRNKSKEDIVQEYKSKKGQIKNNFTSLRRSFKEVGNFLDNMDKWNPFDESQVSPFFSPTWMFGIENGFDIIIGNPPYVGEKANKNRFDDLKKSELRKYYQRKADLFYFFFHLSVNTLSSKGILAFITTNYYTTATAGKNLRKHILEKCTPFKFINFNELTIFESAAGQHNLITFLKKGIDKETPCEIVSFNSKGSFDQIDININSPSITYATKYYKSISDIVDGPEFYFRIVDRNDVGDNSSEVLSKIASDSIVLGNYCNVNQGILTGVDKVSPKHILRYPNQSLKSGDGVYVISMSEYSHLKSKRLLKNWFKNSDIHKYTTEASPKYKLIYVTRDLEIDDYPDIKKHLYKFEDIIKDRPTERGEIQAALKLNKWWVVFAARNKLIFESEKIVAPQRSLTNCFGYNTVQWYASADVYYITSKKNTKIPLKYILGILNSKLGYFWLYNRGKRKGEALELYQKPLSEIPIKYSSNLPIIKIVDSIISKKEKGNDSTDLEQQLDLLVYKLYNLTYKDIRTIDKEFWLSEGEYSNFKVEGK